MFKTSGEIVESQILCFGHLNFENLVIVSNLEFRASYLKLIDFVETAMQGLPIPGLVPKECSLLMRIISYA